MTRQKEEGFQVADIPNLSGYVAIVTGGKDLFPLRSGFRNKNHKVTDRENRQFWHWIRNNARVGESWSPSIYRKQI